VNTNEIINITSRPIKKCSQKSDSKLAGTKVTNPIMLVSKVPSGHKSNKRCEMVTGVGMEIAMRNQNKETETFELMYMK